MPKLNILVRVLNNESNLEYTTQAILTDEIIKYKAEDNTLEMFDYNKNILIRENNELRMNYVFNIKESTKGTIYVKELNKEVEVDIKTNKIERNNNDIDIDFQVEDNNIKYHIEVVR